MNKNNCDALLPGRLRLVFAVLSEFYNPPPYPKKSKFSFCTLQDDLCLIFSCPSNLAICMLICEGTSHSENLGLVLFFNKTAEFIKFKRKEEGRRHVSLSTCCQKWVNYSLERKSWPWNDDLIPMVLICHSDGNRQAGFSPGPWVLWGVGAGLDSEPRFPSLPFRLCSQHACQTGSLRRAS